MKGNTHMVYERKLRRFYYEAFDPQCRKKSENIFASAYCVAHIICAVSSVVFWSYFWAQKAINFDINPGNILVILYLHKPLQMY